MATCERVRLDPRGSQGLTSGLALELHACTITSLIASYLVRTRKPHATTNESILAGFSDDWASRFNRAERQTQRHGPENRRARSQKSRRINRLERPGLCR